MRRNVPSLLIFLFFILLFSEQKQIAYWLLGPRMLSPAEIVFFTGALTFTFAFALRKKLTFRALLPPALFIFPLLAIAVMYLPFFTAAQFSFVNTYLLCGISVILFLSYLMLFPFKEKAIARGTMYFSLSAAAVFLVSFILTRFFLIPGFFYGEATPALHYPFLSPNQAAIAGGVILLLGMGCLLSFKRCRLLYLFVPVMIVAMAQTGSRSGFWLILMASAVFFLALFFFEKVRNVFPRLSHHVLLCILIGGAVIALAPDSQTSRAASMLSQPVMKIISGNADPWRAEHWKPQWEKTVPAADTSISLHNAYLDFLRTGGRKAIALFVLFLTIGGFMLARLLIKNIDSPLFPFFLSLACAFFIILGGLYANPVLHLRFIWAFFGLVLALFYSLYRRE